MKQLLTITFALAVLAAQSRAQSILPDGNQEYCPNTNYNFTVTVPGTVTSITSFSGGCIVVSRSGNTFVGKFNDANTKQVFLVEYKDANNATKQYYPDFKKVKSLLHTGSCSFLSLSPIQAPICQTTNIPYSFTATRWYTAFESPDFCFGTISTYEYLLPAGWKLNNGTPSNGTNWQQGSNSVIFTPDATTGGSIQVRSISAGCTPASAFRGPAAIINISRPGPTFSLLPMSVQIDCGTPTTQTYTVTMTGTTTCPATYQWNISNNGINNGWTYNGNPAPLTPFIAPASITLTSLATNPFYGNVSVTPLLNGVPQTTLTSSTTFKQPNMGLVGGDANICSGTSSPYYLYNAPANSSIFWGYITSLPNYGATVVSVDNQYSSSTTLTKINSGVISLTASATDACNQTYFKTRENILVGGYAYTNPITGYTLAFPPCYTQGCTPQAVSGPINSSGPYGTTVYSAAAYTNTSNNLTVYNTELVTGTWSLITGSVSYWYSSDGNHLTFYPGGGSGSYVLFRLTYNSPCGTIYYDFNFYPTQYNPPYYYRVSPNPTIGNLNVSVDEDKLITQKITKSSAQDIREIVIVDKMAQTKYKQVFTMGTRRINTNIAHLPTGTYFIRIFNGKDWQTLQFFKQ